MSELREYHSKLLSEDNILALEQADVTTVDALLYQDATRLHDKTKLPVDLIQRIQRDLQKYFCATPVLASDHYQSQLRAPLLPTRCCLDLLLGGGLATGELTELVGPTSCGKTQMAMFTSLQLAKHHGISVLYIDTSSAFSADRVVEMHKYQLVAECQEGFEPVDTDQSILAILDRIKWHNCYDPMKLIEILENTHIALESKSSEFYDRLKLIVVDSVGTLLSSTLGGKSTHGHFVMMRIARLLKSIADHHQIAVLVTNNTVGADDQNGQNKSGHKPGLGESWAAVSNHQLMLDCEFNDDENIERSIMLEKSTRYRTNQRCLFTIDPYGIH
ncbi:hypothetical protein SAMD00019534_036970 [Acytostelium subglobosum LB1]|uniref:hypothetical protein n=1 Tax=Acytostelium subglobosum LB1 TaxID=1410327 RepID=UPI000644A9AF|nr:hypothetical protein SAMD00019534_036970 [Acytostelium subglobosum LB1]GAM20522.1 hypothetical protein SAMD00019534_036970 [Acytostelium subglobosum LB1]|eukprot:XP_012760043.1 hypothetical protein SAMD00019534_036970 [Acytostelium subglobosum LB1]